MIIKKNIGKTDRKIRITFGTLLIIAAIFTQSIIKWLLFFSGMVLIITSLIGFCGFYTLFGINTCKFDKNK